MPEQVRDIIKEAGISDEDLNRRGSSGRYFEILQSNGVGNAEDESCVPSYLLKVEDEESFKYSDSLKDAKVEQRESLRFTFLDENPANKNKASCITRQTVEDFGADANMPETIHIGGNARKLNQAYIPKKMRNGTPTPIQRFEYRRAQTSK